MLRWTSMNSRSASSRGAERSQRPLPKGLEPIWEAQSGNCFHCGLPMLKQARLYDARGQFRLL